MGRNLLVLALMLLFFCGVSFSTFSANPSHKVLFSLQVDETPFEILTRTHRKEALYLKEALGHRKNGRYDACLDILEKLSETVFEKYQRFLKASCLQGQGKLASALALVGANYDSPLLKNKIDWDLLWLRLEILTQLKQTETLKKIIVDLRRKYPKDKEVLLKSAYFLGSAYLLSDKKAQALDEFLEILVENPGSSYDRKIFALLKNHNFSAEDHLSEALWNERALKLMETGYAYQATKLYEALSGKFNAKKRYQEKIAASLFKEKRYEEAARLYEEIFSSDEHNISRLEILVRLAKAYARSDQFEKAIAIQQKILKTFPGTSSAGYAEKKLKFLYFDSGQYDKAIQAYEIKPTSLKEQDEFHGYRFWSYYFLNDFEKALEELKAREKLKFKGKSRAEFLSYWQARIFEKLKKTSQAKTIYQSLIRLDSQSHYGLLAQQRLKFKHLDPKTLFDENLFDFIPQAKPIDPVREIRSKVKDETLIRAIVLFALHEDNSAFEEADAFVKLHKPQKREDFLSLSLGGNFFEGYRVHKQALAGQVKHCDEVCASHLGYPQAYKKYVEPFAKHWGIDENLIYAVMRQESTFKPKVKSWAYAMGLMQIIPPTGDEIAQKIGFKNFSTELLNEPRINIFFGSFYLKFLLDRFENNPVYALAAYNAGPDAVSRWLKKYKTRPLDEFIELIPYEQTKDYIKKVLWNDLVYRKVY